MEILLSDEFRLFFTLLQAAALVAGTWRFISRRLNTDWANRAADALLLVFLIQYLSIALPGLVGLLNPLSIAFTTFALSAALFFAPVKSPPQAVAPQSAIRNPQSAIPANKPGSKRQRPFQLEYAANLPATPKSPIAWTLLAATLFAIAYLADVAWNQCLMPVTANDAITYHFPAAVQWLQTSRLSLFQTWFFNPANTYSPLAGSTFIAWWIAPVGNDLLARHVQLPALLLIFFASIRLMRTLGASTTIAALLSLALLLSRPFLHQAEVEKDDLYLAAFFACAAAAFANDRLRDPLAPWRIGVALGLLLATKYTALLALPALLLLIDAPFRARWPARRYAITLILILLLAGPWYLRNIFLTSNPLYPIEIKLFGLKLATGLMTTARSLKFNSPSSIWTLITDRKHDQSLPTLPMLLLLAALLAALVRRFRAIRSDPLVRLSLLGPPIALIVFIAISPYPEVRFLDPAFILLFAAAAIALACLRPPILQILAATILLISTWATGFNLDDQRAALIASLAAFAAIITTVGLAITWLWKQAPLQHRAIFKYVPIVLTLALAAEIYMAWAAYVKTCRNSTSIFYPYQYGPSAEVWKFIREDIPPTQPIAYTNTFLIHPMQGFDNNRPLQYIPTRRGITNIHNLPPFQTKLTGEQIVPAIAAALTADTNPGTWQTNLFKSQATHVVIFDHDVLPNPPEQAIVNAHPEKFEQVFKNEAATIYRLKRE